MKKHVLIPGVFCIILFIFFCNPGFAGSSDGFNKIKSDTNLVQSDFSTIFLAKKEGKANKRQNGLKKGIGTGKGQGLQNQKGDENFEKGKKENSEKLDNEDGDESSEDLDDENKEKIKKKMKKKKG